VVVPPLFVFEQQGPITSFRMADASEARPARVRYAY
jgi:hypothetical protein